jgi:hypothetical protein
MSGKHSQKRKMQKHTLNYKKIFFIIFLVIIFLFIGSKIKSNFEIPIFNNSNELNQHEKSSSSTIISSEHYIDGLENLKFSNLDISETNRISKLHIYIYNNSNTKQEAFKCEILFLVPDASNISIELSIPQIEAHSSTTVSSIISQDLSKISDYKLKK